MTKMNLSGMSNAATTALEGHVRGLFDDQNAKLLIVGELEHWTRSEPGPASNAQPTVNARLRLVEVPGEKQQDDVRNVLRALYLLRTARGTLDEAAGSVNLDTEAQRVAEATSALYVGDALEARAVLRHVHTALESITSDLTIADVVKLRRKIRKVVGGLEKFLTAGASVESLLPEFVQAAADVEHTGVTS